MSGKSHAKALVRRVTGREVPDILRELYVDKRQTQEEVALSLGVSRDTVIRWLAEYDITRNDREPLPPLVDAA